jgi:hypothetical protein
MCFLDATTATGEAPMIAHRSRLALGTAVAALLLMVLGGCRDGRLPVYPAGGKVLFPDGKPLSGGWLWTRPLQGKDAPGARGQIRDDGTFELGTYRLGDGAVEGEHLVLVAPLLPRGDRAEMLKRPKVIDPRFESFDTSRLKITVARDSALSRFSIQVQRPR